MRRFTESTYKLSFPKSTSRTRNKYQKKKKKKEKKRKREDQIKECIKTLRLFSTLEKSWQINAEQRLERFRGSFVTAFERLGATR